MRRDVRVCGFRGWKSSTRHSLKRLASFVRAGCEHAAAQSDSAGCSRLIFSKIRNERDFLLREMPRESWLGFLPQVQFLHAKGGTLKMSSACQTHQTERPISFLSRPLST